MKIVFLDAATLGNDVDLSIFSNLGEFVQYEFTNTQEDTIARLQGADVVITNKSLITKEVIAKTTLKLICVAATGVNNVDLEAANKAQIPVKNVAGYSTNSVVTQTFASLLALLAHVEFYNDYCHSPFGWVKSPIFVNVDRQISEIYGKKFGIIGLGTIGTQVAKIATAFGANVCYYSTSGKNTSTEFQKVDLDTLLKECDIISIHCALTPQTKGLIAQNELNKLKDGAVIMNFGRGGIIDEAALAKALDEKDIRAALDVFTKEPIAADSPFLHIKRKERLVMTPHTAWTSIEARRELLKRIVKNIEDFKAEFKA